VAKVIKVIRQRMDAYGWWRLEMGIARAAGMNPDEMPKLNSQSHSKWQRLLSRVAERLLLNNHYTDTDEVLDATPKVPQRYCLGEGVDGDYLTAIAPDPTDTALLAIRACLSVRCREQSEKAALSSVGVRPPNRPRRHRDRRRGPHDSGRDWPPAAAGQPAGERAAAAKVDGPQGGRTNDTYSLSRQAIVSPV
jgi:hypothetical protein